MHLSSFLSVFITLINRGIIRARDLIKYSLHLIPSEVKSISVLLWKVTAKESLLRLFVVVARAANMAILIKDFLKLKLLAGCSEFLLFRDWFKNLARSVGQQFSWLDPFLLNGRESLKAFFGFFCYCVVGDSVWAEGSYDQGLELCILEVKYANRWHHLEIRRLHHVFLGLFP